MTGLDLLASDLGVSGRTLRRPAGRGALRVLRPSPNTVDLSASERRYVRTHWSLIDELTRTLRTEKNVRLATLFGSAARGDDHPESDVDLLVELDDYRRGGLPLARIGLRLESIVGRPVQLVAVPDAETSPALLLEALRDGRILVDRDGRWPKLARRRAALRRRAAEDASRAQRDAWRALDALSSP